MVERGRAKYTTASKIPFDSFCRLQVHNLFFPWACITKCMPAAIIMVSKSKTFSGIASGSHTPQASKLSFASTLRRLSDLRVHAIMVPERA